MWVSNNRAVKPLTSSATSLQIKAFINTFSHSLKSLNSPLTWVFTTFPQVNPLVTTTTYKDIDTPVRFPNLTLFKNQSLKVKTCKVSQVREG